jgi:hypothetical protein
MMNMLEMAKGIQERDISRKKRHMRAKKTR